MKSYRIDDSKNRVYVLNVIYSRRDQFSVLLSQE